MAATAPLDDVWTLVGHDRSCVANRQVTSGPARDPARDLFGIFDTQMGKAPAHREDIYRDIGNRGVNDP